MMGKDPAFLFYSKDWLSSDTIEMSAAERGVYINLLAYQHINGSIPQDIEKIRKIAMCSDNENFYEIWKNISHKFIKTVNRMVNQRLVQTVSERSKKAKKNRIIGIFASLIRQSNLTKKQTSIIKTMFNVDSFTDIEEGDITKRLTEWFNETVSDSFANANGNGGGNGNKIENKKTLRYLDKNLDIFKTDKEFLEIDVDVEYKKFCDYLKYKEKKYKDYSAAFRNWLRSDFNKSKKKTSKYDHLTEIAP